MTKASFKTDPRKQADLVDAMGHAAARLRNKRGAPHWASGLFRKGDSQGAYVLREESEPSSALLGALAFVMGEKLIAALNELPQRARRAYLVERLRIARKPAEPDRAPVLFRAAAGQEAVEVASGTDLVAREENREVKRRYRLRDPVTVSPVRLEAVASYQRLSDGRDFIIRRPVEDGRLTQPFCPYGRPDEPDARPLPRALYIVSDLLLAARKGTRLTLAFSGVEPNQREACDALSMLHWGVSTPEGYRALEDFTVVGTEDGEVQVRFRPLPCDVGAAPAKEASASRGAQIQQGQVAAIRLARTLPDSAVAAEIGVITFLRFRDLRICFEGRGVPASELLTNGKPASPGAPFLPFGDPAEAESTLHIGCGAVFGLPLKSLEVTFDDVRGPGVTTPIVPICDGVGELPGLSPAIAWERAGDGGWVEPRSLRLSAGDAREDQQAGEATQTRLTRFGGSVLLTTGLKGQPFSSAVDVAGQRGHWLRLTLRQGDFGWSCYQLLLERYGRYAASSALKGGSWWRRLVSFLGGLLEPAKPAESPQTEPPARPAAPRLTGVQLDYESDPVALSDGSGWVQAWNELDVSLPTRLVPPERDLYFPFRTGTMDLPGELYVGLSGIVPNVTLSTFIDIQAAGGTHRTGTPAIDLEYFSKDGWRRLALSDGTKALSDAGIMRGVVPKDWPAVTLRHLQEEALPLHWLRVKGKPDPSVAIHQIGFNAGEAKYQQLGEFDETPGEPLRAGSALAPEPPVIGVAGAATALQSSRGHLPERETDHIERAGRVTRHRDRAISPWDVENLVRDAFSELALVHCIPAGHGPSAPGAGSFVILLVPDQRERLPRANAALRDHVTSFVSQRACRQARVEIGEVPYVEIEVRARVRLKRGTPLRGARAVIEKHLSARLHPRGGGGGELRFGQPIALPEIQSWLASLEQVEKVERAAFGGIHQGISVVAPRRDQVLASAEKHHIEVLI